MGRIRGWIHTIHTGTRVLCDVDGKDAVFVEEIPKNAIRGEATVEYENCDDGVKTEGIIWMGLPDHLIGKKVSFIIIPEEE